MRRCARVLEGALPKDAPILVAVVGGSGSGKSCLTFDLQRALRGKAARLSLDDFYRDRSGLSPARRAKINFDHPRAIDWKSFERVLNACRAGRTASVPVYDFNTHCRQPAVKRLKPKPILLVDGLWLLRSPKLRQLFEVRIFLECSMRTRLRRRLGRDRRTRGRSRSLVLWQFRETVEPMHCQYVAPQKRWATMILPEDWAATEMKAVAADLRRRLKRGQVSRKGETRIVQPFKVGSRTSEPRQ